MQPPSFGSENPLPVSMSISVINFPLGSYTGFAFTSIVEDFIAGYDEPGLPVCESRGGTSTLATGDPRETGEGSLAVVLEAGTFNSLTRGACLKVYQRGKE